MVERDWQVGGLGGLVQVEGKDEEQGPFEVDGKDIFSTAASRQRPTQERRRIMNEAKGKQTTTNKKTKGSHCA